MGRSYYVSSLSTTLLLVAVLSSAVTVDTTAIAMTAPPPATLSSSMSTSGFGSDARWISPVGTVSNGTFAAYRTILSLSPGANCTSATVNIATDTKYWLYVNGVAVAHEGGLKRGPSRGDGYYDSLDLGGGGNTNTSYWRPGQDNQIAVLALFLGRRTVPPTQTWWNNEHSSSGTHALLIDGMVCGARLVTKGSSNSSSSSSSSSVSTGNSNSRTEFTKTNNRSSSAESAAAAATNVWRAVPHPAYTNDLISDLSQNFRFSEPDIVYDAKIGAAFGNWTSIDYKSTEEHYYWPLAVDRGRPGEAPWGKLVPRPIPLWRRSSGTPVPFVSVRQEYDGHDGDGYRGLGAGDIPGQDLNGHAVLPPGCCKTLTDCKRACTGIAACRAVVWGAARKSCNLKGASHFVPAAAAVSSAAATAAAAAATGTASSPYTVYIRAYKRLVGKFPYDTQFLPALYLPAASAAKAASVRIDIRTDSYFTDGSSAAKAAGLGIPNTRAAYIVGATLGEGGGGEEGGGEGGGGGGGVGAADRKGLGSSQFISYESPGWMVGHEVHYSMDVLAPLPLTGANALQIAYTETGYDADLSGAFHCNDAALTTLWRKAQRTLYVNMRDNWMDCPDRERSQWTFDVAMDAHQAAYALSPSAHALSRKWLLELVAWQKRGNSSEPYAPESIYAPIPGHWMQELPDQTLQTIAYGLGVYYDHTADVDTVRSVLPAIITYLLSWKMQEVDMVVHGAGDDTVASGGGSVTAPTVVTRSSNNSYSFASSTRGHPRIKPQLVVPRSCPGKVHGADVQCPGIWDWCDGQSTNCDYAPIDNAWYWWALNTTRRLARAVNFTTPPPSPPPPPPSKTQTTLARSRGMSGTSSRSSSTAGGQFGTSTMKPYSSRASNNSSYIIQESSGTTPAQLAEISARADSLAAAYDAVFWDESCTCYRSAAHRTRAGGTTDCQTKTDNCTLPDDRANALAIVTGLASPQRATLAAVSVLDPAAPGYVANSSTAMEKFALEALLMQGQTAAALDRMRMRFGPMIASNLTTLWEHWEADPTTGMPIAGYNHGWSGGVLVLLSQYIAGLAPTRPGWQEWEARPRLSSSCSSSTSKVDNVIDGGGVGVLEDRNDGCDHGSSTHTVDRVNASVATRFGLVRLEGKACRMGYQHRHSDDSNSNSSSSVSGGGGGGGGGGHQSITSGSNADTKTRSAATPEAAGFAKSRSSSMSMSIQRQLDIRVTLKVTVPVGTVGRVYWPHIANTSMPRSVEISNLKSSSEEEGETMSGRSAPFSLFFMHNLRPTTKSHVASRTENNGIRLTAGHWQLSAAHKSTTL